MIDRGIEQSSHSRLGYALVKLNSDLSCTSSKSRPLKLESQKPLLESQNDESFCVIE